MIFRGYVSFRECIIIPKWRNIIKGCLKPMPLNSMIQLRTNEMNLILTNDPTPEVRVVWRDVAGEIYILNSGSVHLAYTRFHSWGQTLHSWGQKHKHIHDETAIDSSTGLFVEWLILYSSWFWLDKHITCDFACNFPYPYAPCMEYLPTFGLNLW